MGQIIGEDRTIELDRPRKEPGAVQFRYLASPTQQEWQQLRADYLAARGKTYDGITLGKLKKMVEDRRVGVYEINLVYAQSVERTGSFALQLLDGDIEMKPRVTFIYIRLTAGTITQGLVNAVMRVAQNIGQRVGASHILIQGRPGWDAYLKGWGHREISRTWLVDIRDEPGGP